MTSIVAQITSKSKESLICKIVEGNDIFEKNTLINVPRTYLYNEVDDSIQQIIVTKTNLFGLAQEVDVPKLSEDPKYVQFLKFGTKFNIEITHDENVFELVNCTNPNLRNLVRVEKDDIKYINNGCEVGQVIRIKKNEK